MNLIRTGCAKGTIWYLASILLLCATTFFFKLGFVGFLGPDEPRYAQVAYEMMSREDLVSPTLLHKNWFEKPALLYWLMQVSYRLLGVTEFSARLPSALLATGIVVGLWLFLRRVGATLGFATSAALMLATSPLFIGFARGATFELVITAAIFVALLAFFFLEDRSVCIRRAACIVFYVFLGVGVLAKGLIGIVLPIGAIILFKLTDGKGLREKVADIRLMHPILGFSLTVLTASIWYAPVCWRHGGDFVNDFFIAHHFQRFTSNRFHHPGPLYYYAPVLLLGTLPWTPFLIAGALRGFWLNSEVSPSMRRLIRLSICSIAAPLILFSVSGSKLPGYILPAWPACAILSAYAAESYSHRISFALVRASGVLLSATAVVTPFIAAKLFRYDDPALFQFGCFAVGAGALIVSFFPEKKEVSASNTSIWRITALSVVLASFSALVAACLLPSVEDRESLKWISVSASRHERPQEFLTFFRCRKYAPVFYASQQVLCCDAYGEPNRADTPAELVQTLGNSLSLLVIAQEKEIPALFNSDLFSCETLHIRQGFILVRISPIQKETKNP